MPADQPDWENDVDLEFFPTARWTLREDKLLITGGDHFCLVESFLNPNGSRNLGVVATSWLTNGSKTISQPTSDGQKPSAIGLPITDEK
jgi:hypothetical protein